MEPELSCQLVRAALWDHAGGRLGEADSGRISTHLLGCRECDRRRLEVSTLATGLKDLPVRRPPSIVSMRLRVAASRDRSRRLVRLDMAARWKDFRQRARLTFDNLLKPLAVPAAGGILASFLCFGVIVNNLHLDPSFNEDMPVGLYRAVTIDELSPFCFEGRDVLVQLSIDRDGNVTDFMVPQEKPSPDEMREIGNLVLYSSFKPARAFGQPVSSKVLLLIQHSTIRG
jgi:hypothetical protein